ncbi:MAG: hypothetical protein Q4A88_04965, partial [Clostridia bacterium]|nr:hypothetical protein [Clostridia bacterium]
MEQYSPKKKRSAWHIVLEAILAIAFFGACMYGWSRVRPSVLHTVFAEEFPTESPTMPPLEQAPVAYSAYNEDILFVSEGTPVPTP